MPIPLRPIVLLILLTAQASAWRFDVTWLAGLLAVGALTYAAIYAERWCEQWHWGSFAALCVGLTCSVLGQFQWLWPCDLGCSSGKSYSIILFDISTLMVASIAYGLLLVALAFAHKRLLSRVLLFIACGGSLYFIALSIVLNMLCPICMSIHISVLCAGICAWPPSKRLLSASSIASGALTLCLFFLIRDSIIMQDILVHTQQQGPKPINYTPPDKTNQQQAINDFIKRPSKPTRLGNDTIIAQVKAGRLIGDANATYRLDCHISLSCGHCERMAPHIYNSAQKWANQYSISIDTMYLINLASKRDKQQHSLALAAALRNEFLIAQSALFTGNVGNGGYLESLTKIGIDAQALQTLIDQHQDSLMQCNTDDRTRFYSAAVPAQRTPIFILWKGDTVIGNWNAKSKWPEISRAIEELIQ